jgi:peptidyl-prolyl cis-trans isomerase B (cyclophilin B)
VFGEVTEGMDVVDKIQQTATDGFNRPYTDVRIIKATLTKDPFKPVEKPQPQKKAGKGKRRR